MELQRCTERRRIKLLRRAGNPRAADRIAADGRGMRRNRERRDAVAALSTSSASALAAGRQAYAALRDAIFEADFQRAATNAELALRNGISLRHFQRWRAEAVAAIARFTCDILGPAGAEPDWAAASRSRGLRASASAATRDGASTASARPILRARDAARRSRCGHRREPERFAERQRGARTRARMARRGKRTSRQNGRCPCEARWSCSREALSGGKIGNLGGDLEEHAEACAREALRARGADRVTLHRADLAGSADGLGPWLGAARTVRRRSALGRCCDGRRGCAPSRSSRPME